MMAFSIRGRFLRAGAVLLAGWLMLEIVLMQLVAARIGWGAVLSLLILKGGAGLLLVAWLTMRGLSKLRASLSGSGIEANGIQAAFWVASAILITLPGFIPALAGIMLLTPSLQRAIINRFRGGGTSDDPKAFDLEAADWKEIRRKKLVGTSKSRKASLEAGPPSV
jgi:UPF0716 family protein affecting phage T7 exclusion